MEAFAAAQGVSHASAMRVSRLAWRPWIALAAVFAVGFVVALALLSANSGFASNDDYYHSRIAAQIIEQRALRLSFPWLPFTILSPNQFVDHHLLYHMYLSPWAYWGGIAGTKIAQAVVMGGVLAAAWGLLRSLEVRWAALWAVALLGVSAPFLYRMLMARTQAAALLLLLVALLLLFRKRHTWLLALAFTFTWLYNGFVLLPAVVALYTAAVYIAERRIVWQPLAYTLAGTALGLVINPYFPQNIAFIVNHLGEKTDIHAGVRVGNEWYPYTTRALLLNSPGALLALAGGALAPTFRRTGRDHVETTLLLTALLTLYMTLESRRFIEYFPAFALLFCACAWGRGSIHWPINRDTIFSRLLKWTALFAGLGLLVGAALTTAHDDIRSAKDESYLAGAARWLQENTEPGALVFQIDWDDFPYLFYHNTHNTYLVGLDPTYLQLAHPRLWNLWVPITQGQVERPSALIRDIFGALYTVSDTAHSAFAERADADPDMQLVYRDANSMVWQIRRGTQ